MLNHSTKNPKDLSIYFAGRFALGVSVKSDSTSEETKNTPVEYIIRKNLSISGRQSISHYFFDQSGPYLKSTADIGAKALVFYWSGIAQKLETASLYYCASKSGYDLDSKFVNQSITQTRDILALVDKQIQVSIHANPNFEQPNFDSQSETDPLWLLQPQFTIGTPADAFLVSTLFCLFQCKFELSLMTKTYLHCILNSKHGKAVAKCLSWPTNDEFCADYKSSIADMIDPSMLKSYELLPIPKKPVYITTPIYYVNDSPHIGHTYTTVLADALARWWRSRGAIVHFMTGTDEHGQKIQECAEKANVTPKAFADKVSASFKQAFNDFNIQYDHFIRTTDANHEQTVLEMWKRIQANGDIYLGQHTGWYSVADEEFFTEIQVMDAPDPKNPGQTIKIARETGGVVQQVSEENYKFRLSKYQKPLLDWIKQNPKCIQPENRKQEVVSFLEQGLMDLSISRTKITWGVPVPNDPKHVMYVWIDALSNYLTSSGWPHFDPSKGSVPSPGPSTWPADYHIIGKDILRFHAIYWPAFLMSAGLPLPKHLFAHGWWTKDKNKISKRTGNIIDPWLVKKQYGLDAFRFFLINDGQLDQDCDYSDAMMKTRLNWDLADGFGNLINRAVSIKLNPKCSVPHPSTYDNHDKQIIKILQETSAYCDHKYRDLEFSSGLKSVWTLLSHIQRYIQDTAPWKLRKSDPKRADTVIYVLLESLRIISLLVAPVMPDAANKIFYDILGLPTTPHHVASNKNLSFGILVSGSPLGKLVQDQLNPNFDKTTLVLFPKQLDQETLDRRYSKSSCALCGAKGTNKDSCPIATGKPHPLHKAIPHGKQTKS